MTMLERMQAQMAARIAAQSKATDTSAGSASTQTRIEPSNGQVPSPPHSSDVENDRNSHSSPVPTTSTRAPLEPSNASPPRAGPSRYHARALRTSSRRGSAVQQFFDTPSPAISRRLAPRSGISSPGIPRRFAMRFHGSAVVAGENEDDEHLTPLPVKTSKGAKGKKKHTGGDEDSTPIASDIEVQEPTPIPAKKARGGRTTKSKGKKRVVDELDDDETAAHGDRARKSKHQRTGK